MERLKVILHSWKYPSILLFGIGLSNIGAWIYFIALNLIVLQLTNSPLALSILYIIRPIAGLFTNLWAGSVVDRINKKQAMILLDFLRAILLCILPFTDSIMIIYIVTFIVQLAGHVFGHTSIVYITKLIPEQQRPRFNSLNSLLSSGAFIIGPAIAGLLFLVGTPTFAIYINIAVLFVSGLLTFLMPNVEQYKYNKESNQSLLSLSLLKKDFSAVTMFYKSHIFILVLCLLFGGLMVVMATAVDSLEASFATFVLLLTESDYGLLVSIAGVGMGTGAIVNVIVVKKLTPFYLMMLGVLGNGVGYCIYAFSNTFLQAATGFFILAFFLSFANTGFMIFYQNNIPVNIMGRIGAFNGLIESLLIIIITAVFGVLTDIIDIRAIIITGVMIMMLLALIITILCLYSLKSNRKEALE